MEEKSDFHNFIGYLSSHTRSCVGNTHKNEARKFAKRMAPAYEAMDHPIYDRSEAHLTEMLCGLVDHFWRDVEKEIEGYTPEEVVSWAHDHDDADCMSYSTGGMKYSYKLWDDGSQGFTFTFEYTQFLNMDDEE